MKRVLLVGLVIGLSVSGYSQRSVSNATQRMQNDPHALRDATVSGNPLQYQRPNLPKATSEVDKVKISSSLNVYTVLVEEQSCMAYNSDLDLIMMTHRGQTNVIGTGNDLITSISTDGGNTFSSNIAITSQGGRLHRYPSGVIYNSAGNTNVDDAYSVMAGPYTVSSWEGNYFASTTFGGANTDENPVETTGTGDLLSRNGLTIDNIGNAHMTGLQYVGDSGPTSFLGYVYKGTFDNSSKKFNWTSQTLYPDIVKGTDGAYYMSYTQINTAWAPDGSVGYVYFIGSDARAGNDRCSYQPVVYKSTDGGETWNQMAYIDLKNNSVMSPYLYPLKREWSTTGTVKPMFAETDGVVDANGNLHIFTLAKGCTSDHIDSIGYVYTLEKGAIFELYNEGQGDNWTVSFIDTLEARDVPKEESGYGTGTDALSWGHRIQASRSDDGKVVFVTWTDTDIEFFGTEINLYPDILAFARHLDYGPAEVKNFTRGSNVYGEAFYSYASEVTIDDGTSWQIPYSITDIRSSNDPGLPVTFYYVKDLKFELSDFPVGIESVSGIVNKVNAFPNPTNGTTTFSIELASESNIEISLTNLMGQTVRKLVSEQASSGTHQYTVDLSDLTAGVYFYDIIAGQGRITRKLVVK